MGICCFDSSAKDTHTSLSSFQLTKNLQFHTSCLLKECRRKEEWKKEKGKGKGTEFPRCRFLSRLRTWNCLFISTCCRKTSFVMMTRTTCRCFRWVFGVEDELFIFKLWDILWPACNAIVNFLKGWISYAFIYLHAPWKTCMCLSKAFHNYMFLMNKHSDKCSLLLCNFEW